ncbi:hypothetical protein NQ314_003733 [Rhamnusium bicolor]|uniref:DUF7869 domain-containing protein n=1 Tax=Rhamnusium bicolor TaxID=1586634 RepID=A0AAV8ZLD8_9CUCU|nr:hypothetical protein NQ314_003733 [Rhamnusium bicolor]
MYRAYIEKFPRSSVTYKFCAKVFHTDFPNLRFGRPRSDICGTCDMHNNKIKACTSNDPEKRNLMNALQSHHRKAEKARITMNKDMANSQKITSDTNVISIDLEQVLFLSFLTHSAMFYSRQLSYYNLGIHSDLEYAFMCLWNESLTGRGGNEIASGLLKTLSQDSFQSRKRLVIWSDNCIGQNKNKIMLMLLIYLVISGVYEQVEQTFLVSSHSYLSCDRDCAQIEKRKKVTKTFVPDDIKKMIVSACHKKPFKSLTMEAKDFIDFQKMADDVLNMSKLKFSPVAWILIGKDSPTVVKTRKSFNEMESWVECNVIKKGKNKQDILERQLPLLECKNRISMETLKNLEDMLYYIPLKHLDFWENLIARTNLQ